MGTKHKRKELKMKWARFAAGFFVGWLTLCLILVAVVADAAEIPKDVDTIIDMSDGPTNANKPVKLITRTNVIYVWPCGQVAKESLEILNENEELLYFGAVGNGDVEHTIVLEGEHIIYDKIIDGWPVTEKTE